MGASMEQGGSSRRRGARRQKRQPMAEINVTPFVDVMLVLLIIFMVTAPLLSTGVPVDLPASEAKASAENSEREPLTISVRANGSIFLQETETSLEEIVPKLTAISEGGFQQVVYVRADSQANYGALMRVMGKISGAGFQRISLVTDIEQN